MNAYYCLWLYIALSCLKQRPLNFTLVLWPGLPSEELRNLLGAEGDLMLSPDNPLDFYDVI